MLKIGEVRLKAGVDYAQKLFNNEIQMVITKKL
jgi:hypothetical protein